MSRVNNDHSRAQGTIPLVAIRKRFPRARLAAKKIRPVLRA